MSIHVRRVKTEIRKEQLTKAVLRVIATSGVRRLSMARVAQHVGLVPSAIYRHFRSKDEMLGAMLEFIGRSFQQNVADVCAQTADPLGRLKLLLMRHMSLIRSNAGIPRVVYSEEVFSGSALRKRMLREIIVGYLARIAEIVRDGQTRGSVRRDLDPGSVSLCFLGLIQPAVLLWHLSDGEFDVILHTERGWKIFVESIVPRSAPARATRSRPPKARG